MANYFNTIIIVFSYCVIVKGMIPISAEDNSADIEQGETKKHQVSGIDLRIVGGNKAPEEYGKFHASIQNLTGYHVCGGAVVSKWFVVTAAHCVAGVDPQYMKIITATNNLDDGGKQYNVDAIFIYDKYNSTSKEHDIAILKTRFPFDLRQIEILRLRKEELQEGDAVILLGFGAHEPNGLSSNKMYALELPVFNQETCKYAMRTTRPVYEEMFCTFTRIGEGTCHGDSGSPLIKDGQLVGVVSWGIPCARGFPDVHTRITPYIKWIQEYIRRGHCVTSKRRGFK